jgi:hypothetical protein
MIIPVLRHAQIRSWPTHDVGGRADYMTLADAMTREFAYDAHFATYSVPEIPGGSARKLWGIPLCPTAFGSPSQRSTSTDRVTCGHQNGGQLNDSSSIAWRGSIPGRSAMQRVAVGV